MKYFSNNPIFFQKNHKNFQKIIKTFKNSKMFKKTHFFVNKFSV